MTPRKKKEPKLKKCSVDGCAKLAGWGSYCKMHASRLRRNGSLSLKTPLEKLLGRVRKTEKGCWEYQWYTNKLGYGRLRYQGVKWLASRLSWRLHFGEIPDGMLVCHHCDNPPCVNPEHLFLGTHRDNVRDCMSKGRFKGPENSPWIR